MSNPRLTKEELEKAEQLLDKIRSYLDDLSGDNRELRFAYNRRIYNQLQYDERLKPAQRKNLKKKKRDEQNGICPLCSQPLPEKNVVLDRFKAIDGYTIENTRLIHRKCDEAVQEERGYS